MNRFSVGIDAKIMSFAACDRLSRAYTLFVGRLSVASAVGTFGRKFMRPSAQLYSDGTQAVVTVQRLQRPLHVCDGFGFNAVSIRVHVSSHTFTANIIRFR